MSYGDYIGSTIMLFENEYNKIKNIDRINEIIASVNGLMSYNDKIMEIVDEEAATYFDGSKSAQDAAELIQKRVQLYLDENA